MTGQAAISDLLALARETDRAAGDFYSHPARMFSGKSMEEDESKTVREIEAIFASLPPARRRPASGCDRPVR